MTSRGDRREAIYEDEEDRERFLALLGNVASDFNWVCHAWCLMGNHYHLVIETPDGNLSKGMRQLNGVYTQYSNRRHRRVGHLFQGRYKAILVDGDSYLLELARYVVLNPVRAGMVKEPGEWPWSSYLAMVGKQPSSPWLETDGLLAAFGQKRAVAIRRYREFVFQGIGEESIWINLKSQVFLGDEDFVAKSLSHVAGTEDVNVSRAQRRPPPPSLEDIVRSNPDRNAAIIAAYASGGYSYQDIGSHFGLHFTTVAKIVRQAKPG
ncbi:hypothetical protein Y5S_01281 [Alcanivorax nanhaiticus]|uniref:Transposase IS200-like domain-containing protein n=1 Tax=Alcanivorax nanhaiticus TaxID=1177154 RepID=A0A095TSK9_9GAMM|nr:hypothetical protein Y5S_01281 [Alcanivorax nanhaiticus]